MAYVPGEHTYDDVDEFLANVQQHESWHDQQSTLAHMWDFGETDEAPVYVAADGTKMMAFTPGLLICLVDGRYEYHSIPTGEIPRFVKDSE